jgi:hypothetical protein
MPALTKAFFIFEDVSVGYDGEINVELVLLAQDTRNQVISRWGRLLPWREFAGLDSLFRFDPQFH